MIKKNKIKAKLKKNQLALGSWVLSNSSTVCEIMSQSGFDWVCVDAEHSQVTKETALEMFRAIELHGAEPFVRISLCDEVEIKKYLDMGARGIVIPMVKSYEDVRRAISYIKFSPEGNRSFALPRCTGYGEWSDEYFKQANEEIFIAIMIEHIDAIPELDNIFSCSEIDAVFIGPYDLSGSMRIPGEFENPKFIEVIELINQKAKEYNITIGYHEVHPSIENINMLIDRGFKFIACGIDTIFILEKSKEFVELNRK